MSFKLQNVVQCLILFGFYQILKSFVAIKNVIQNFSKISKNIEKVKYQSSKKSYIFISILIVL